MAIIINNGDVVQLANGDMYACMKNGDPHAPYCTTTGVLLSFRRYNGGSLMIDFKEYKPDFTHMTTPDFNIVKVMRITDYSDTTLKSAQVIWEKKTLAYFKKGETFRKGGIEWVVLDKKHGDAFCITKDIVAKMEFGCTNQYIGSTVNKYIKENTFKAVGGNCPWGMPFYHIDTTSMDGVDGAIMTQMALMTFDEYRKYKAILNKFPVNKSWWLITPHSTSKYNDNRNVCYVDFDGHIQSGACCCKRGVRPCTWFNEDMEVEMEEPVVVKEYNYAEICQQNSIESQCKNARKEIEEAVKRGHTSCYIVHSGDRPAIQVINMLLGDGFDIFIQTFGPHQWWLKADWHKGASGKIFKESCINGNAELTYNELVEMLTQ